MDRLLKGFKEFSVNYFSKENTLHDELVQGQHPKVLVIACCDSRVDPAIILNAKPGDLFVIRNVANIIPPICENDPHRSAASAIEYAVKHLNVSSILILGHAQCGGIQALLNDSEREQDYISDWVTILNDAKSIAENDAGVNCNKQKMCELEGIKLSRKNLLDCDWVQERINAGTLSVHGWHYDFDSGDLLAFDDAQNEFRALK